MEKTAQNQEIKNIKQNACLFSYFLVYAILHDDFETTPERCCFEEIDDAKSERSQKLKRIPKKQVRANRRKKPS